MRSDGIHHWLPTYASEFVKSSMQGSVGLKLNF
jgi:hypothetical protein